MSPRFSLEGRAAFVTGGARGIGAAIARGLAQAGAHVALTWRENRAAAEALTQDLPGRAIALPMEVCDRASIARAAEAAEAALGPISILINNAGINRPADFDQITDEDWDAVLDVNLTGPFRVAQIFLPLLKRAGGGAIVHIGSVSGQYGGPRTAHYAASKAGLISLSQVIARFGAKDAIRSNVVAAGLIASDMADAGLAAPAVQKAAEAIVMKRLGTREEVADAVVWLASDAASYVTAQTINVNGGLYF